MNNYCIISHQYQFIYIPIAKAACTTLLNRIAEIIHGSDMKKVKAKSHRDVHAQRKKLFNTKTSELSNNTGRAIKEYSDYFKFAFVRNPFDRVQSCYIDKLSLNSYGFDNNLTSKYSEMYRGMSFVDFLKLIEQMSLQEMDEHFRPQYSFFDISLIDFIGKVEKINEYWKKIEEDILKIPYKPLPVFNKTQEVDYYDNNAEKIVIEIYKKDFELFKYDMVREPKKITKRELPILITTNSKNKIYPFKDVFLKSDKDSFLATVTGDDPIIIIPYFSLQEGKQVHFQIDLHSPKKTTLTLYYTTHRAIDSPQSKQRSVRLHKGENQAIIILNDDEIVGRFRLKISSSPALFKIHQIKITEHTFPWREDPNDLTEINKGLFSLPPYTQKHKNLFSMCNFASIYQPILNSLKPKHICEIGCDKGNNTWLLADYCKQNSAQLTIIDPVEIELNFEESNKHVRHIQEKSIDFLSECDLPADVYFIDGDHNYSTVSKELKLINTLVRNTKSPVCLFMHDISWPWAYRDLYYAPEELGIKNELITKDKGVSLYSSNPVADGLPSLKKYAYSIKEGGVKNGVRKAIEDFLKKNSDWDMIDVPSLYGLGILWTTNRLSPDQEKIFRDVKSHLFFLKEFLSILEWNRVALYCQTLYNAGIWKQNQEYIKTLEKRRYFHKIINKLRNVFMNFF